VNDGASAGSVEAWASMYDAARRVHSPERAEAEEQSAPPRLRGKLERRVHGPSLQHVQGSCKPAPRVPALALPWNPRIKQAAGEATSAWKPARKHDR
jgi:hypothetical protein